MAQSRLPMRKIKEVLRLKHELKRSHGEIARSCGTAHSTVLEYLRRAAKAGLSWPLPSGITEEELERRLFPAEAIGRDPEIPLPDCQWIYDELRRWRSDCALTLTQLWVEYKERFPTGYQYTQFCEHYRRWLGKLDYVMRQEHRGGEKLFVDYTGGLAITNPETGEKILTQLFVGTWGASNYTCADASLSQELPNWIASHVRAFRYFGCAHVFRPEHLFAHLFPGLKAGFRPVHRPARLLSCRRSPLRAALYLCRTKRCCGFQAAPLSWAPARLSAGTVPRL